MKRPLEMSSQINWIDIIKRFLLIFLPPAILFGSITYVIYFKDVNAERLSIENNEIFNIDTQLKIVASNFNDVSRDLKFLASQNELAAFLQNHTPESQHQLVSEWLSFCSIKPAYSKILFINKNGIEVINVTSKNGKDGLVPPGSPHDMASQDYFKKTMTLGPHNVYISPFDTSSTMTDGQGTFQPIVHFSTPIFDKTGNRQGILVLNYRGTLLLDELKETSANSPGSTVLVNGGYYYLADRNQDKQWDVSPSDSNTQVLKKHLPKEWQRIRLNGSGQFRAKDGLVTFGTIYPLSDTIQSLSQGKINFVQDRDKQYYWKTVSYIPTKVLSVWPRKILNRILLLYSFCLAVIAVCALLLARTSVKRNRAEETIREREEHLRAINSAAANAIIVIDSNKKVLHWNPAAEKLFHYTYDEAKDKPITAIIAPPKHQSTFTKISKKFNIPEKDIAGSKTIELFGYKKDGTEFPVEVSFSAFKSRDHWHTVGIIRDISARKKMEKEVLQAQKFESLGGLASGIAHDFNNLLTAITGNINLVRRITNPKDENYELLESAEKAAIRAKSLSQQLLIFSKRGNPVRKTTSITPLVKDSADFALHGSIISCSINIQDDLWLVDIDTGQMSQVIQSLIMNGKEAISGSGAIEISCHNVSDINLPNFPAPIIGNFIQLRIHDTGCGISQKDLPKIFDPYYSTKTNGRGLGLSIVYSIIQKHDGHITVQSEPGLGTTVTIFLPASLDQHQRTTNNDENLQDRHYQIMVIDGEEMLLNIARRMLVHLGHECICVKNSMEAIEIYKHLWKTGSPVDGVIVDLTIPGGMGGKETAGAIYDINPEAKIIVSSGYTNDPVMNDYDEYGFCAAIAKPFDMAELKNTLNSVMG